MSYTHLLQKSISILVNFAECANHHLLLVSRHVDNHIVDNHAFEQIPAVKLAQICQKRGTKILRIGLSIQKGVVQCLFGRQALVGVQREQLPHKPLTSFGNARARRPRSLLAPRRAAVTAGATPAGGAR